MRTDAVITLAERELDTYIRVDVTSTIVVLNPTLGRNYRLVPDRAITLGVSRGTSGRVLFVRIEQPASGGFAVTSDPSINGDIDADTTAGSLTFFWLAWDEEDAVWDLVTPSNVTQPPYQPLIEKDAASGYAGIDSNCVVAKPAQFIRAGLAASRPASGTAGGQVYFATDGARCSLWKDTVTLPCSAPAGDPTIYQVLYEKNRAGGYVGLDANLIIEKPIQYIRAGPLASRDVTGVPGQVYFHTDGTQHLTIWK